MPKQTISSSFTFFYKYIFPTVWISGFGAGTIFIGIGYFSGGNDGFPFFPFLFAWIVVSGVLFWSGRRLKAVEMDADHLYISNFRKTIQVPRSAIAEVSQFVFMNPEMVTIRFKTTTEFGDRVSFLAHTRLFRMLSYHPIVAELREKPRA